MIVVLKDNPDQKQLDNLVSWLKSMGLDIHFSKGETATIMGLIGDTSTVDIDLINSLDIVDTVKRVQEPYKNVNRKFHPEDTVVEITDDVKIGGGNFQVIAGPCSVESEEQVCLVAREVKKAGAGLYRGGAFKPRTSPYAFQGMRDEGIKLAGGQGAVRDAYRHRSNGHFPSSSLRKRRCDTSRRQEYAELRAAQRTGPYRQAYPPQARPFQHPSGIADERRIHHGGLK